MDLIILAIYPEVIEKLKKDGKLRMPTPGGGLVMVWGETSAEANSKSQAEMHQVIESVIKVTEEQVKAPDPSVPKH